MTGQVRFTTMAIAMNAAFEQCKAQGRNPGRVGHRVLTNNARGVGKIIVQRDKEKEEESKAVSAGIGMTGVQAFVEGVFCDRKVDHQPTIKVKKSRKVVQHA